MDFITLTLILLSFVCLIVFVSGVILLSVLERHKGLHDPLSHVMLRRDHRRHSFLHPLREIQSFLCRRDHVFRFKLVLKLLLRHYISKMITAAANRLIEVHPAL